MKLTDIDQSHITDDMIKEVLYTTPKSEYEQADCLILFGCHIKSFLDERIELALSLLKKKRINYVLLTGGVGEKGNFNESEYMKEYLLNYGISEEIILIDDKSATTEENIINSIEILKNHHLLENKKIVIASSQVHLRRIAMMMKKQLKDINVELVYEYPENSNISYGKVINDEKLKPLIVNQLIKIIQLIDLEMIDDEDIKWIYSN